MYSTLVVQSPLNFSVLQHRVQNCRKRTRCYRHALFAGPHDEKRGQQVLESRSGNSVDTPNLVIDLAAENRMAMDDDIGERMIAGLAVGHQRLTNPPPAA